MQSFYIYKTRDVRVTDIRIYNRRETFIAHEENGKYPRPAPASRPHFRFGLWHFLSRSADIVSFFKTLLIT